MGTGSVIGGGAGSTSACAGQLAEDTFTFALCACEQINVGSQLTVDAFDSAAGPYNAALPDGGINRRKDGHTGLNGGPLLLSGKLTAAGNLYVSGGGVRMGPASVVEGTLYANGPLTRQSNTDGTVGRNAFVNGDISTGYTINGDLTIAPGSANNGTVLGATTAAAIPQQDPCPCQPQEIIDVAAFAQWAQTHNDNSEFFDGGALDPDAYANGTGPGTLNMPCGRYYLSSIQHGGTLTLVPQGRVVLFVNGNMSVGGINIMVTNNTELDLFVAGDLSVTSAATFGNPDAPSQVRTYVAGDVTLSASAVFAGNVYAPNASVGFNAAATVYGALFVRTVSFSGNSNVHFDSAIRQAGQACNPPADGGVAQDAGPASDGAVPDAATPAPDAGTPDAGPQLCGTRCNNTCTGGLACFPSGMCGSCSSDLDCCAPETCLQNTCGLIGG